MAFGMQTASNSFLPIVKYDARAGKFFKVDKRIDGGSDAVEIQPGTKFALDFGSFEAGYVSFGPQGPVRHMVPYHGEGTAIPPQPQDKDAEGKLVFRPGFYAKVAGNALDGAREWCSNAAVLLNAMDELYQTFIRSPEAAQGQIPIICIASTIAVKSGTGARTSTNYAPVLRIEAWTARPELLGPRTVPPPGTAPAMNTAAAQAMASKPAPAETQGWGASSAGPVTPAPVAAPVAQPASQSAATPSAMPFAPQVD